MRPWLVAAGFGAAVSGVVGEFRSPVNGDVAYMLDAARRMLGGERLYVELLDLNPPFMFWLSQPATLLAEGAGSVTAFRLMVVGLAAAMLALAWPLTRQSPVLRIGYVLIAFVLPLGHFGEREHVMFCLVVPYVALAVLRAQGGRSGKGLAIATGMAAGAAMVIKPPALLLGLALVADQWRRERSLRILFRPEHLAAAGTLLGGFLAILAFAPEYLGAVRRYAGLYAEFSRGTIADLLFGHLYAIFTFAALCMVAATAGSIRDRATITVLSLAAVALYACAVVQAKGFGYHYLPAYGLAVMAALELVVAQPNGRARHAGLRRLTASLLLLVMLSAPAAVALDRVRGRAADPLPERQELARALAGDTAGTRVAVLSIRLGDAYPMVLERRFEHVLSMPHLWFAGLPDRGGAADSLWLRAAQDIATKRPGILVHRAPDAARRGPGDVDFDYLERLCEVPSGPAVLRGYGLSARVGGYDVYRRNLKGAPACASS